MRTHPRTLEGGFWHKKIYPHQMWLDGLYMEAPFYAEYAEIFNEPSDFDDVIRQFELIYQHTRDPKTGLPYHGWDESKSQRWADPLTGCSPNFWGRAIGWYGMAIVDVLDYVPINHPQRAKLIKILNEIIPAIIAVQDEQSGVWFQVLNQGGRQGNYLESSASCMFVYTIAKGIRCGYLNQKYREYAEKAYQGIIKNFITVDDQEMISLKNTCKGAGLGQSSLNSHYRDGSFQYYVGEPVVSNDYHGVGSFILASVERELLHK